MDATSASAARASNASTPGGEVKPSGKAPTQRREIPGNLAYTTTPGSLKSVLDALIKAEVPEKVTQDFVSTVLGLKGGSAAQQIPVLKRLGLVSAEGKPTERYSRFRSDTNRSAAALEALRAGYQTIFQKNTFAHKLSEGELRDLVAEITGLKKTDPIVGYICGNFDRVRSYITDKNVKLDQEGGETLQQHIEQPQSHTSSGLQNSLGLNYVINIVLPHSNSIETYNLIFRSLRENIIDWSR